VFVCWEVQKGKEDDEMSGVTPAAGTGELWDRCLWLVQQFLAENGFAESLRVLESESGKTFSPERGVDDGDESSTAAAATQQQRPVLSGELLSAIQRLEDLDRLEAGSGGAREKPAESDPELCARPSGRYPGGSEEGQQLAILKPHSGNVLCVKHDHDTGRGMVLSSGSDRSVAATRVDWERVGTALAWRTALPTAAIALEWSAERDAVLAATMGGTSHVLNGHSGAVEQTFGDHRKFVVAGKWVLHGRGFVTGSHDRRVVLRRDSAAAAAASGAFEETKEWMFAGCVEAMAVLGKEQTKVVVSVREDNRLHVIDLETGEVSELLNMNATGDDHVSFTALDLSVRPSSLSSSDGRHLLVSTDRDRLILFDVERGVQVRNFYGAANDEMSQPKHCWDHAGQYVFSTSQDNTVRVWEVASQRAVAKLTGHSRTVRSVDYTAAHGGVLASGSYDSTVRLWPAIDHH
jgi:WD40 repeat protein